MVKLSIIVPIYGVEQYLRRCVDSLLAQDLPSAEYEIILVDDESPDACPQICNDYAAAHENIHVVHRKNGGLSAARNSGIEVARGKYVMFVDSDDYLEPNVVGELVHQMEHDYLDVLRYRLQYVNSQYQLFSPFANPFRENDYSEEPTDGETFLNTRMNTQCYAWTFVVRREIIPMFTEGIHFEDVDWTPRMQLKASRVASTPIVVYNYLIREGSITQEADSIEKRKRNTQDALDVIAGVNQLIAEHPDCIWLKKMRSDLAIAILNASAHYLYPLRSGYIDELRRLKVFPLTAPYSECATKFKVWLYNLSPRVVISIKHMLHRIRHKWK